MTTMPMSDWPMLYRLISNQGMMLCFLMGIVNPMVKSWTYRDEGSCHALFELGQGGPVVVSRRTEGRWSPRYVSLVTLLQH